MTATLLVPTLPAETPSRAISAKTIARLAHYRRVLLRAGSSGRTTIFSHEIASICDATPAQVRRDLMAVGTLGHPIHGYAIEGLLAQLDRFLDAPRGVRMALVGVGNLGRALLTYFARGRSYLTIEAAFDTDPAKIGRMISGCRVQSIDAIAEALIATPIDVGVIAVPEEFAQHVADLLVGAGVRSLLNLAPTRLHVPDDVFVEDVDLGIAIERAAFYARHRGKGEP
ncbi:MAG: redox-sensing transcriptional repressor Rex [Thermoanaerobaculia bacterium]